MKICDNFIEPAAVTFVGEMQRGENNRWQFLVVVSGVGISIGDNVPEQEARDARDKLMEEFV